MCLTATKLRQLLQCLSAVLVILRENREGYENLIRMKTRIVTTQIIHLGMLDWLNHRLRNQLQFMVDARQMLGNIQYQCRTATQQLTAVTADNRAIHKILSGHHIFLTAGLRSQG